MKVTSGILSCAACVALMGICFAVLHSCGSNRPPSPIRGDRAFAHVQAMVEFGPRPSGSSALVANRDYIVDELKKLGLAPKVDSFEDTEHAPGITFHNVSVEIAGTRTGEKRLLMLGSHYDTKNPDVDDSPDRTMKFVGANDAASSSGLLIEIARHVKENPLPCPTLFLWFDGEESIPWTWDDDRSLFGSRHAAAKLSKQRFNNQLGRNSVAFVLLDMVGAEDLRIVKDNDSSPELYAIFEPVVRELDYEQYFFQTSLSVIDDHKPFRERGVRVINLIQFGGGGGPAGGDVSPWWHTHEDDLDIISPQSLEIVGHVVVHALPKIVEAFCK